MSLGYISWSVLWMKVTDAKSACGGLGYYGENIRPPSCCAKGHLRFWTKANLDNRVCPVPLLGICSSPIHRSYRTN